jgi:hypothetical protein
MDIVHPHWPPPPVASRDRAAVGRYEVAVAALVAGAPHAGPLLDELVAMHADFALGQAARAVRARQRGVPFVEPVVTAGLTRAERQHLEVVRTWLAGDAVRATDLRREHLAEFPGDLLIVWLPEAG